MVNYFYIKYFLKYFPVFLRSGIACKFKCGDSNAAHYGKTKCPFKVRMCEHLRISALTGMRVKENNGSTIKEYHLLCNHSFGFEDFSILASNNNFIHRF